MLALSNVFCGVFCIAILFIVESGVIFHNKTYEDKKLQQLILVDAVYVIFNIAWQIVDGRDFIYAVNINYAINLLIYFSQLYLGICYYRYLFYVITRKEQKSPAIYIPAVVLGLLVVFSLKTKCFFYIDNSNNYVFGKFYFLFTVLSYFYFVFIVAVSLVKWKLSSNPNTRKRAAISSSLIIPPLIFSLIQIFVPALTCLHCFGITLSIASVFVRIQKQTITTNTYKTEVARENATRYRNTVLSNALQFMVINLTTNLVDELSIPKRPDITVDTLIQNGSIHSPYYIEIVSVWSRNIVDMSKDEINNMYDTEILKGKYNKGEIKLVDEFKVLRKSGVVSWCRQEIILAKNEQTNDIIATVTVYDITEQKNKEYDYNVQQAVIEGLAYGTSSYWVVDFDTEDVIELHMDNDKHPEFFDKHIDKKTYSSIIRLICSGLVRESDYDDVSDLFKIETIRKKLTDNKQYIVPLNLYYDEENIYQQISYTRVDLVDKKAFIVSTRDITDNVEKERALRDELTEALEKTKKANEAKSSFLFNMSHDIRTPMNAILGFNEIATKYIDDKERALDALNKARYSGEHMLGLINDILDMSRIESGKMQLCIDIFNVKEHVLKFVDMFALAMEQKGIEFVLVDETTVNYVYTDYLRVSQIIANLLSNALKFTDKGGTVTFKVVNFPINEEGYIGFRIHIKDTGIGMSEEFQKRIFQSFERENTATVSGVQGTGLGLAITKSLVELLGGSILFTSELGKGTEFVITFRAKVAEKPEDVYLEEVDDFISLNGIKVLVVEDNELNREIVTELLESEGIIVTSVEDGSQAVNIIDESKEDAFDLVLMDVQMPVMNGYDATKAIRNLNIKQKADIPIVAMTANAFEDDRNYALSIGMNEHIAKPIDVSRLLNVIQRLI